MKGYNKKKPPDVDGFYISFLVFLFSVDVYSFWDDNPNKFRLINF